MLYMSGMGKFWILSNIIGIESIIFLVMKFEVNGILVGIVLKCVMLLIFL